MPVESSQLPHNNFSGMTEPGRVCSGNFVKVLFIQQMECVIIENEFLHKIKKEKAKEK